MTEPTSKSPSKNLHFRRAEPADHPRLEAIRKAAFAPVFASFRAILGDTIYQLAQAAEDDAQEQMLTTLLSPGSGWENIVAELNGVIVGFMALELNRETTVGEIGLNGVDPAYAGQGIGTQMYIYAVDLMRNAGMQVATVATGGDPSHAPARRAYEKAGFDVQIPSVWYCQEL